MGEPLSKTHPDLAREALFDATAIGAGSHEKRRWRCALLHEWEASVRNRARGVGCPVCANKQVLAGFNDLATTHPKLALEALFDATSVIAGTNKKLEWRCPKGHEYEQPGSARVKGVGCSVCAGKRVAAGVNDLASVRPDLATEALFDPTRVVAGTHQKLKWRCPTGHEYLQSGAARLRGRGCPVCANRRVEPGVNDLATTHPELAKQALFDPTSVVAGTPAKLRWRCDEGHEWSASGDKRAAGQGCPVCANRKVVAGLNDLATTHPELAAEAMFDASTVTSGSSEPREWQCTRGHEFRASPNARVRGGGCPICSNKRVQPGINDLATTHPELAAEALFDPTKVIAGTNKRMRWRCKHGHEFLQQGNERVAGAGCPYCSNKSLLTGFNDLATTHPELAAEALFDPTRVIAGTAKKLKWRCASGHEWTATGNARTSGSKSGCPVCANRDIRTGVNDLATTHPELAREALFDPTHLGAGSHKVVPWKCNLGHQWQTTVKHRVGGTGCPYCSNKAVLAGFNDLATTQPALAAQALFDPRTVSEGSSQRREWKCDQDHVYRASVVSRTNGSGCPYCSNKSLLTGFNDLATTHPELAAEALFDPTRVIAGTAKKLKWRCASGHEWTATGNARTSGSKSGCPHCARFGYHPEQDGYLYLLRHSNLEAQQIGITNTPKNRLGTHQRAGWEVLELRGPMNGYLARDWERDMLTWLRKQGVRPAPGNFDGYTESWSIERFQVATLTELMNLVRDSES